MTDLRDVLDWLGRIDIYVLDQVMRGRLVPPMRVLDAGCGDGRNLLLFARAGFDVAATDASPDAIAQVRSAVAAIGVSLAADRWWVGPIEALELPAASFDAVLCNAVLHFARNRAHFDAMVAALFRVLAPGGVFFARLATTITLEGRTTPLGDGRHRLPDGAERFLVVARDLHDLTERHQGDLLDPIKTTNVADQRAMTTWVVRKR